jgi:hypothetical protein
MQRVESAVGGTLTVVRGHLPERAPSAAPTRVRARWTDAGGHPLAGDTAIVGPALPTSKLREHSLARVRALHEARAEEITRGGPFEAAFGALPEGARGVALDVESAPAPEPAVAPVESTSGTEAAATASSPPAARPSSE